MIITYDNTSLVNAPYNVKKMTHENADSRALNVYELARQRGGILLNADYKPKRITIEGIITGTSNADLESHIDEFKELMGRQGKNLDIEYASGTRRFVATAQSVVIERDFYHLTFAPYKVEFYIPAGVGIDTALTTDTTSAITALIHTAVETVFGSVEPKMKIEITVTSATSITEMSILANGNKVTLTATISTGDVLVFDGNTLKVTQNGTEKYYTGIFPSFVVGANAFSIEATGTAINYSVSFVYNKTYI